MHKTNDLATKKFVKKVVQRTEDKLRGEIRKIAEGSEKGLKGLCVEMKKNHGEVMEKLDSIAWSIRKFDQEQTALSYRV